MENVDGVGCARSPDVKGSPLTWMLDDPSQRLRSLKGYTVETVQGVLGTDGAVPQNRPRTLFFGARAALGTSAAQVVKRFRKFLSASARVGVYHINTFLLHTRAVAEARATTPNISQISTDDQIAYLAELSKALRTVKDSGAVSGEDFKLPPEAERPSFNVSATARTRAAIDVGSLLIPKRLQNFIDQGGCESLAHPVADVSVSYGRLTVSVDGTLPTLTTGALIYSYMLRAFIEPRDLFASMAYPPTCMDFLSAAAQRSLVGNGYVVRVSAFAVAAVCTFSGHLEKRKDARASD